MARIDPAYIRRRFRAAFSAKDTTTQGRILEGIVCHIMTKIPGIAVWETDVLSVARDQEIDIAFFNTKRRTGVPFMSDVILVECKCTSNPIGAAELSRFEIKLRDRLCDWGVFVAASGITGDADRLTAAHQAIATALSHGHRILVITRDEIEGTDSGGGLVRLLRRKYCQLTGRRTSLPL